MTHSAFEDQVFPIAVLDDTIRVSRVLEERTEPKVWIPSCVPLVREAEKRRGDPREVTCELAIAFSALSDMVHEEDNTMIFFLVEKRSAPSLPWNVVSFVAFHVAEDHLTEVWTPWLLTEGIGEAREAMVMSWMLFDLFRLKLEDIGPEVRTMLHIPSVRTQEILDDAMARSYALQNEHLNEWGTERRGEQDINDEVLPTQIVPEAGRILRLLMPEMNLQKQSGDSASSSITWFAFMHSIDEFNDFSIALDLFDKEMNPRPPVWRVSSNLHNNPEDYPKQISKTPGAHLVETLIDTGWVMSHETWREHLGKMLPSHVEWVGDIDDSVFMLLGLPSPWMKPSEELRILLDAAKSIPPS